MDNQPTTSSPEPQPSRNFFDSAVNAVTFVSSWVIIPLAAVLVLHFFIFQAYHVDGNSMINTLHTSDYLIISKIDYTRALISRDLLHHNTPYIPARNQIIVFHYPGNTKLIFVKRTIGLPGDRVVIKGGKVTIYNKEHPGGFDPNTGYEPAGTVTITETLGDIDQTIPAGDVFVLGDNRGMTDGGSFDSRSWGLVPSANIIGNAVARLLPLDQAKIF